MTDRAESCGGCRWRHGNAVFAGIMVGGATCKRFPKWVAITDQHWCGEFQPRAPQVSEATRDEWEKGPEKHEVQSDDG